MKNIIRISEPTRTKVLKRKDIKLALVFDGGHWFERISVGNGYFIPRYASESFLNKHPTTIHYQSTTAEWFDSDKTTDNKETV